MSKILVLDQVDSGNFSPTTGVQVLRTDTLPSSSYAYAEAKYKVSFVMSATAATQTLTFNITINGAVAKAFVVNTQGSAGVTKFDLIDFDATAPAKEGGVIKLELAAAAGADAQTVIVVKRVQIEGHN